MANYKSSVMSAPPLNRYGLTVNSHRGYVVAATLFFASARGRVLRDPIRNKYPREKCIRIFFKIVYPTKFYEMIHDVDHQHWTHHLQRYAYARRATFAVRRIYRALSDTNKTSFNYSYIVLQSKTVPQPSDCSPTYRDNRRFSVLRQTCVIYSQKLDAQYRYFFASSCFHLRKLHHVYTSSIYLALRIE